MAARNAFHAQSGGVTAVIDATACGLIKEALRHPERIGKGLAGRTLSLGNRRSAAQGDRKRRRKMPAEFISSDGFHITDACRTYLQQLIEGEDPPPFRNGLPDYVRLKNVAVPMKLGPFSI